MGPINFPIFSSRQFFPFKFPAIIQKAIDRQHDDSNFPGRTIFLSRNFLYKFFNHWILCYNSCSYATTKMRYKLILAINRNSKLNQNYFSRDILTLQGNFCHKEPSPPPLPVYIRASLNLMVLYGETRSGQGYKARYGNSILLENSSKPRTPRFPGRTASAVFERRVNAELSSQVFDESLSSLFAYTLTGVTRACYVAKFGKNIS